ncbi:hypothetical protein Tco_0554554 [Tanacetum coccineum]
MYISLEQHKLRIIDKMEKVRALQHIYRELKWMACTRTSRWLLLLILFRTFERQWSGTEVVGNCTRHCGAFTATSNVETLQIEDLQGVTRKSPQDRAWARCHIAKVPAAARRGKSGVLSKVTQGFKHRLLVNKEVAQGDQIRRRMSQG